MGLAMNEPVRLQQTAEAARFDPEQLERLCRDKGEERAESEAAEALDRINRLLEEIYAPDAAYATRDLLIRIEALIAAADKIGMSTLSTVSRDVRECLSRNDDIALSATMSRLARVGERSIHAIFDLEDQSI